MYYVAISHLSSLPRKEICRCFYTVSPNRVWHGRRVAVSLDLIEAFRTLENFHPIFMVLIVYLLV